jgi:hypothetical protein
MGDRSAQRRRFLGLHAMFEGEARRQPAAIADQDGRRNPRTRHTQASKNFIHATL